MPPGTTASGPSRSQPTSPGQITAMARTALPTTAVSCGTASAMPRTATQRQPTRVSRSHLVRILNRLSRAGDRRPPAGIDVEQGLGFAHPRNPQPGVELALGLQQQAPRRVADGEAGDILAQLALKERDRVRPDGHQHVTLQRYRTNPESEAVVARQLRSWLVPGGCAHRQLRSHLCLRELRSWLMPGGCAPGARWRSLGRPARCAHRYSPGADSSRRSAATAWMSRSRRITYSSLRTSTSQRSSGLKSTWSPC